jgi:hypothetical protein
VTVAELIKLLTEMPQPHQVRLVTWDDDRSDTSSGLLGVVKHVQEVPPPCRGCARPYDVIDYVDLVAMDVE